MFKKKPEDTESSMANVQINNPFFTSTSSEFTEVTLAYYCHIVITHEKNVSKSYRKVVSKKEKIEARQPLPEKTNVNAHCY